MNLATSGERIRIDGNHGAPLEVYRVEVPDGIGVAFERGPVRLVLSVGTAIAFAAALMAVAEAIRRPPDPLRAAEERRG